jgi:hypothetical protein
VTLDERARRVESREDLALLIENLADDLEANPAAWENHDLPRFLGAMAAWVKDGDRFYQNTGEDSSRLPPWRLFADILMAARIYE